MKSFQYPPGLKITGWLSEQLLSFIEKTNKKNYHELSLVSVYDIISTRRTSLNKERANKQDLIESHVFYLTFRMKFLSSISISTRTSVIP